MENTPITFDQLPAFVYQLGLKVDNLMALLRSQSEQSQSPKEYYFSIEELSDYLPDKPAITTLYGKVQRREIPFARNGKRLFFPKSKIDAWLESLYAKTATELSVSASQHTRSKKRAGRRGEAHSHV